LLQEGIFKATFVQNMFNRVISIFILVVLMLTNFSRLFIYASFELNQEYIASTLCVNRDKPEINCNGKCYLSKKIKQAEEKEKKQELDGLKKSLQESSLVKSFSSDDLISFEVQKDYFPTPVDDLLTGNSEILHPPPSLSTSFS
jgi:hypothetical protein